MADVNDLSVEEFDGLDVFNHNTSETAESSDASEDSDLNYFDEEPEEESHDDEDNSEEEEEELKTTGKKSGFKKRIDGLIKKNAELEERLAKFESNNSTSNTTEKEVKTEEKKLVKPVYEDFDSIDDYNDAMESYLEEKILGKIKGLDSEKLEAEKTKIAEENKKQEDLKYVERANAATSRYKDFNDTVNNLNEVPMLHDSAMRYIVKSEFGPDIAYYLGKNLDKAKDLSKMSVEDQVSFLTKTESRLASKVSVKKSSVPDPINRVKPKAVNVVKKKDYKDSDLSVEDFIRLRNEQKGVR